MENKRKILLAGLRRITASEQIVYNGSDQLILDKEVTNDFNSLGVWFSSSPDYAKSFGKVRKFVLPKGNYFECDGSDTMFLYATVPFKKIYGEEADNFAKDMRLGKSLKDNTLGSWIKTWDEDKFQEVFEKDWELAEKSIKKQVSLKNDTSNIEELVLNALQWHAPYLKELKKYYMNKGFDGFYFPKDKPLDNQPHEAWLIFEPNLDKPS